MILRKFIMSNECKQLISQYENPFLKEWLCELSLLDGKCCYISKKSELRAKLLTIVDKSQKDGKEIIQIFDEKVWINDGNIYEINSKGLIDLQDRISIIRSVKIYEKQRFDIKNEFFIFTLNQSTLLALFLASIVFTRAILKLFESVYSIELGISLGYFLTLFIVVYSIDKSLKKFLIILAILMIFLHIFFYVYYFPNGVEVKYENLFDTIRLFFMILLNVSIVGACLFSSIYSINIFSENKINVPKYVYAILGVIIYGVILSIFIQAINTITLN